MAKTAAQKAAEEKAAAKKTTATKAAPAAKAGSAEKPDKTAEELLKAAQGKTEEKDGAPPADAPEGTVEPKTDPDFTAGDGSIEASSVHGTTERSEGAAKDIEGDAQERSDWELRTNQKERKEALDAAEAELKAQGKPVPTDTYGGNPSFKDMLATSKHIDQRRREATE